MATNKPELVQYIVDVIKDCWLRQNNEAIKAEANLVAARAQEEFIKTLTRKP